MVGVCVILYESYDANPNDVRLYETIWSTITSTTTSTSTTSTSTSTSLPPQIQRALLYNELVELEKTYGGISEVRRRISAGDRDSNLARYLELYRVIHAEVVYGEDMEWAGTTLGFKTRHRKGKLKNGHN